MTLIAILISYFAMRESWIPDLVRDRQWLQFYLRFYDSLSLGDRVHPALAYGIYVLVPMTVLWLIAHVWHAWVFVIIDFLLAILLLCSTLTSRRLNSNFQTFLNRWRHQEWQAAYQYGVQLFNYSKTISTSDLLSQTLTHYLIRMNQCLFAPILWFLVFGNAGLILYVLTLVIALAIEKGGQAPEHPWKKVAGEFMHALEGVSARVVAISIALLYMNSKTLAVAIRRFRVTDREAEIVLKLSIKMALDFKELPEENELLASEGIRRIHVVQDLCNNVLFLWLLVIALFTLLGWIF
ncbi:MAG: hypothetical protein MI976_12310 [Pseudomonadales bacterium]|nr:hypothetical protein [Pseudomonadales bacterium]